MKSLKPSIETALPPIVLMSLAVPDLVRLRYTLYSVLALPLRPLIRALGLVYRDKPMFLTYEAQLLTAAIWSVGLYLFLCAVRNWRHRGSGQGVR